MNIIAFDFETGGLSPDRHAVTQLAMVACTCKGGKPSLPIADKSEARKFIRTWAVRPSPSLILEDDALKIQGHTRHSLLNRAGQVTENVLMTELEEFLRGLGEEFEGAPLVAHNARFDHGFLDALCKRNRVPLFARDAICTVERQKEITKRKLASKPENNKLATLATLIGLKQNDAHDALQDTKICASVFAWQETLLNTGSLLDDINEPVGVVYKYELVPDDGWWTKGPKEYPVKAPDTAAKAPAAKVPTASDPVATVAEAGSLKPFPDAVKHSALKSLYELAGEGKLSSISNFMTQSGPIEDCNRYVIGSIRIIASHIATLEKIAAVYSANAKESK